MSARRPLPAPLAPPPSGYAADVSVVIVNYNARRMLERTLDTLFESRPRRSLEVIVVDNASKDGSVELVRGHYPQVRCVANERNLGYTRANNQGMALATGRYLLLLNNDTIVYPGAVDLLAGHLDAHPRVGAAGSKVLNIDGTVQGTIKNPPTAAAALFGRHSPLTRLFPRNRFSRRYLLYLEQDFAAPFPAGSVSTCALLVRREAIERAGPMDERFFVYWSDVDWCRAMWAAGFEVWCVPDSVIVHDEHKGGTRPGRRRTWATIKDFHRGAYVYYRKWHVRRPWHPNHAAAAAGLAGRAVVVLAAEHLYWAVRPRRRSA
jgi:N-acetylglucosaminyl-diphospho-decaprenol L-rhamnosyltransferase